MGTLRLSRLTIEGLQSKDLELEIPPCLMLTGRNGTGKSAVLRAIGILVHGAATAPLERFMHAGASSMRVRGDFDDRHLERTWTRKAGGGLEQEISGTMLGDCAGRGVKIAESAIARDLGAWAIGWRPRDLIDLKPGELRSRLVRMFAGSIPAPKMPAWSRREKDETIDAWILRALRGANDQHAILASTRAQVGAVAARVMPALADVAALEANLEKLRGRLRVALDVERIEALLAQPVASKWTETDRAVALMGLERAKALEPKRADLAAANREHGELYDRWEDELDSAKGYGEQLTGVDLMGAIHSAGVAVRDLAGSEKHSRESVSILEARLRPGAGLFAVCPKCAHDLDRAAFLKRGEIEADLKIWRDVNDKDRRALIEATNTLDGLQARVRARDLGDKIHVLQERIEALKSELADHPSAALARENLDTIEAELRQASFDRLELEEELEDLGPSRSSADLTAEIAGLEKQIARSIETREATDAAKARVGELDAKLKESAADIDTLRAAYAEAVAVIRRAVEPELSGALSRAVTLELGDRECRIVADGIDAGAFSDGETVELLAGGLLALGAKSEALWRPLIYDRIETVDVERRRGLMLRIASGVRDGAVSQAILAGCPDVTLEESGWTSRLMR